MPPNQTHGADQPTTQPTFEKYVVFAVDMCLYDDQNERFNGHQRVITCAESEEDAIERACSALETRAGYVPAIAYTAAELRELADALSTRELAPGRAYNLSMQMTDEKMAEWLKD